MRLVRFLAAGKSLVGLKDIEGRYRLPTGHALPQFGTARNAGPSVRSESANQSSPDGSGAVAGTSEACAAAVNLRAEPRLEQNSPPSQSKPVPALKAHRAGKGFIFRRLFGWLPWHRQTPATGAVPVFSSLPVQTELSLENVKVVRNDLSESDLEVQSVRKGQPEAPFSKQQVAEQSSSAATNLSRPRSGDEPVGN